MARFEFRLERVLEWRKTALKLEQGKLEGLRAQLAAAERARAELIERRHRMQRETAAATGITGQDLARLDAFRVWAGRQEAALAGRAAELHRAIAAQAARVVEADRDARLVDRLKERRRETWKAEELKAIDEAAGESAAAQWRRKLERTVR